MNPGVLTLVLAIGWAAATDGFTLPNVLFGALIGGFSLFLIRGSIRVPAPTSSCGTFGIPWNWSIGWGNRSNRKSSGALQPDSPPLGPCIRPPPEAP